MLLQAFLHPPQTPNRLSGAVLAHSWKHCFPAVRRKPRSTCLHLSGVCAHYSTTPVQLLPPLPQAFSGAMACAT